MHRACAAALAGLVLCGVAPAAAQDQLVTTVVPGTQRRWDAVGYVGWRGVSKSDIAPDWDEWYDAAALSASTSRHLTPHVKIDIDLSTTSRGRVLEETFVSTSGPFPSYQLREHRFRRTTVATTLAYQFLENRWVHPFLGVGLEGAREAERVGVELVPVRVPLLPLATPETHVTYLVRPFITGGLKFYMSERGFIRTDLLSTLSSSGAESVVWRVGVGVDF
jgi:hypothetical protein